MPKRIVRSLTGDIYHVVNNNSGWIVRAGYWAISKRLPSRVIIPYPQVVIGSRGYINSQGWASRLRNRNNCRGADKEATKRGEGPRTEDPEPVVTSDCSGNISSTTGGECKRSDAGLPPAITRGRVVLLCIPKSAVIGWVDGHHAVIAPAIEGRCLGAGAGNQCRFALWQGPQRVANQTTGVENRRRDRAARHAVADRDVARLVHCNAPHPAAVAARRVGSLLINRGRIRQPPNLVPTNGTLVAT